MRQRGLWLVAAWAALALGWETARGDEALAKQADRRSRQLPELLVNAGGRQGACDGLCFTADGNFLLATGDDKVVLSWEFRDGKLAAAPRKPLRWSAWREQRGAIYALALSPDQEGKEVAIGGMGLIGSSAAILDRETGEIRHQIGFDRFDANSFWAIAFSPAGDRVALGAADGSIMLWNPARGRITVVGQHDPLDPDKPRGLNFVRLVHFLEEKRLLSVAESGQVIEWDLTSSPPQPRTSTSLGRQVGRVFRAIVSPDKQWLAAISTQEHLVVLQSLNGTTRKEIPLGESEFGRSLAFDRDAQRLAVGVGQDKHTSSGFDLELDTSIRIYDVSADPRWSRTLPHHGKAEYLAFHPSGKYLAVAGGDNQEIALWNLEAEKEPPEVRRGEGTGLWGVGLGKAGQVLYFQDQRDPNPEHPNGRGTGSWRAFDLQRRHWLNAENLRPAAGWKQSWGGWHVEQKENDFYTWYAVHEDGTRHRLKLDRDREGRPNCYTFLPGGDNEDEPVRLAVGHYWGVSVYSLTKAGARRIWLGVGHQGEVTALAAAPKSPWLVSASTDQTITAWRVDSWPSGSELGAIVEQRADRLFIKSVDLFSPAWEAGLIEGDEILVLAAGAKKVFDPEGKVAGGQMSDMQTALEPLRQAEPGTELYFLLRRPDQDDLVQTKTSVRRRPLWRFFPSHNEWVLWMWGHHYYDTSTNGDSFIGWQVNKGDGLDRTPSFYRAEQLRDIFHRPKVIRQLLDNGKPEEALRRAQLPGAGFRPPEFGALEPPRVTLEASANEVTTNDLKVTVSATGRGNNPDYLPRRAELWLNDWRVETWQNLKGKDFSATVTIPNKKLRPGSNDLTFQCYNLARHLGEGRSEESTRVRCVRKPEQGTLYALAVGITNYGNAARLPNGDPRLRDLKYTLNDAETMRAIWQAQEGVLYKKAVAEVLPGSGQRADRATILAKLEELPEKVTADDQVILFFAGHGLLEGEDNSTFVFCCPDYDPARGRTRITSHELYTALAKIPCRKTVFLDACRSGEAVMPVRDLTPGGRGPNILAACDRNEESFESKKYEHGVFTYAILEAAGEKFDVANVRPDDGLDAKEIYDYARTRMPELLKAIKAPGSQTPTCFPSSLDRYDLIRRPAKK
jgi:WD40 repeat protein